MWLPSLLSLSLLLLSVQPTSGLIPPGAFLHGATPAAPWTMGPGSNIDVDPHLATVVGPFVTSLLGPKLGASTSAVVASAAAADAAAAGPDVGTTAVATTTTTSTWVADADTAAAAAAVGAGAADTLRSIAFASLGLLKGAVAVAVVLATTVAVALAYFVSSTMKQYPSTSVYPYFFVELAKATYLNVASLTKVPVFGRVATYGGGAGPESAQKCWDDMVNNCRRQTLSEADGKPYSKEKEASDLVIYAALAVTAAVVNAEDDGKKDGSQPQQLLQRYGRPTESGGGGEVKFDCKALTPKLDQDRLLDEFIDGAGGTVPEGREEAKRRMDEAIEMIFSDGIMELAVDIMRSIGVKTVVDLMFANAPTVTLTL